MGWYKKKRNSVDHNGSGQSNSNNHKNSSVPRKLRNNPLANRVSLTKGSNGSTTSASSSSSIKHKKGSSTFKQPPTGPRGMVEKPSVSSSIARRRKEALWSRNNERSNRDRQREEMINRAEELDRRRRNSASSHDYSLRRTLDIRHAALPPILRVSNLAEGTTAADVRKILQELFGQVKDIRSCDSEDGTVVVEAKFANPDLAYDARSHLDGTSADGRGLRAVIVRINEIVDEPRVVKVPENASNWNTGPPLYADKVGKGRLPPPTAQVQWGMRSYRA